MNFSCVFDWITSKFKKYTHKCRDTYVYACIYVSMYTHMCRAHFYAYILISQYTSFNYTHMRVYMHINTHIYVSICPISIHICIFMYNTYICVCMHMSFSGFSIYESFTFIELIKILITFLGGEFQALCNWAYQLTGWTCLVEGIFPILNIMKTCYIECTYRSSCHHCIVIDVSYYSPCLLKFIDDY